MSLPQFRCFHYGHFIEIIMHANFIIAERYKSPDFVSFHFAFVVNYIHNKNALYSMLMDTGLYIQVYKT